MFGITMIYRSSHFFRQFSGHIGRSVVFAGAMMNVMPVGADEAKLIAQRHASNWSLSLQSGEVDEVLALYSAVDPIVILEKSIGPRNTQKSRKISNRYRSKQRVLIFNNVRN